MKCEDHRLYSTWKSMKARCYNKNRPSYKYYGGKGVGVYWAWRENFWCFVEDMDHTYEEGKTLDRVDNNGDYSPYNCRWATPKEQANNQNRLYTGITYNGETYKECELSVITGVPRSTLQARRLKGWSDYEIVHGKDFRKYEVDGKKYNLKELAEYLGSYPQKILRRLKKKTLEDVVDEFRGI